MKSTIALFSLALIPAFAGEHVVEPTLFETSLSFDATLLPKNVTVLKIQPEEWSTYKITSLVGHGTQVKGGSTLIECETEDYQRHLTEQKEAAKERKISLAKAKRELADLEITTPRDITKARLNFERETESLNHFKKIGRALEEKQASERLDRSKRSLEYVEEELKQLLKMYEDDGVTEETEEIILKRQRSAVKTAKLSLERAEVSTKWTLEKTIPRKAVDKQASYDAAKLKFETAEKNLPRTLEQKRLSVAKAIRNDQKADEKLALLEKDAAFLKLTAPADGTVFYGEVKDGRWSAGSSSKFLFENGKLPAEKAIMTFIPAGSPLELHAFIGQKDRLNLKTSLIGTATVGGLDGQTFPVTLNTIDTFPRSDSKYHLSLTMKLPDDSPLVGGMKAKVKMVTYRNEKAFTVPESAIKTDGDKSTVRIKLADGKDETREIKTGRENSGKIEILSGLEAGQVVLLPEEDKK